MIVIDASAMVNGVVDSGAVGSALRSRLIGETEVATPDFFDVEVLSALRKRSLRGEMTDAELEGALAALQQAPVRRHPVRRLIPRAAELRHNLTPYDAVYVALAETLGATLLTTDRRLANATGPRCPIEVLSAPA